MKRPVLAAHLRRSVCGMNHTPPSRPAGVMAGLTKVGGLRPPPPGGVERGGTEERMAWAGAVRLISHAPRLGRVGESRYSPGLRRSPPPLTRGVTRSEPGILSARTLRGSDGVIFRREEIVGGVGVTGGTEGGWLSIREETSRALCRGMAQRPVGLSGGIGGRWITS